MRSPGAQREEHIKSGTERGIRFLAVLAVVTLIVGIALFNFSASKDTLDFSEFYSAAQMVRQGLGRNLYSLGIQAQFQSRVAAVHAFYLRPPFEALLFLPFTYLSYRAAYTLWTMASLGLLVSAAVLIESSTKVSLAVSQYARVPADFGLVLVIFLTFAPTTTCLLIGQDSMLMLLIYTLVFILLNRGAEFRGGCMLACGLFKFHLVVPFVVILLLRRRWSALRGFAAIGCLLILVSIGVSGLQVITVYPRFLLFDSTYQKVAGFQPEYTPNIRGFLYLIVNGRLAASTFSLLVATLSMWALWWAAKTWRDEQFGLSFSVSIIATFLASYHLYNYDLTSLLLPIAIVCGELAQRKRLLSAPVALTAVLIILFLPPIHLFLLVHSIYALMLIPILVLFFTVIRLSHSDSLSAKARGLTN